MKISGTNAVKWMALPIAINPSWNKNNSMHPERFFVFPLKMLYLDNNRYYLRWSVIWWNATPIIKHVLVCMMPWKADTRGFPLTERDGGREGHVQCQTVAYSEHTPCLWGTFRCHCHAVCTASWKMKNFGWAFLCCMWIVLLKIVLYMRAVFKHFISVTFFITYALLDICSSA